MGVRNIIDTRISEAQVTYVDTEPGTDVVFVSSVDGGEGGTSCAVGILVDRVPFVHVLNIRQGDGTSIPLTLNGSGSGVQFPDEILPGGPTYVLTPTVASESTLVVSGYWKGKKPYTA